MGHSNERSGSSKQLQTHGIPKEGATEAPNKPDEQKNGGATEPNPTRDN